MTRPKGILVDTEPLELWEYERIIAKLEPHWQLFYALLWETGIRVSEALKLTRKDFVDNELRLVKVTRAKRKDHPIDSLPLSLGLWSRFRSLFQLTKRQVIFPFTASAAWLALKKACAAAGIRQSIHPHSFRHGFGHRAAHANLGGGNALEQLAIIQRMMGHQSIESTSRYIKATQKEIEAAFRKLNT